METLGHFKYSQCEISWNRDSLPSGESVDTVSRSYDHMGYSESLTFENWNEAAQKFLNWTMSVACLTDEQALVYFASLQQARDLEMSAHWKELVAAAEEAQAASYSYVQVKYGYRPAQERTEVYQEYLKARARTVEVLADLKLIKPPRAA
jgi:hypothetical protein